MSNYDIGRRELPPTAGVGGTTITVQEEGVDTSTTVTTLNFVGGSVTASGAGATATITVSGVGGGIPLDDVLALGALL